MKRSPAFLKIRPLFKLHCSSAYRQNVTEPFRVLYCYDVANTQNVIIVADRDETVLTLQNVEVS